MTCYSAVRRLLFKMDAEKSHNLTLKLLQLSAKLPFFGSLTPAIPQNPVSIMGLTFANPLGLAAGLDKNGDAIDALGAMGFGFIEVGTVTPRPQPGNPKPRIFRLTADKAIINRLGFNNKGVDYLCQRLAKRRYQGILGVNIGKNVDTPLEKAIDDYKIGLQKVYALADYITINISSPNTANLRSLQSGELLEALLSTLKEQQIALSQHTQRYVPLVVKIAPDLSFDELKNIAEQLITYKVDGVIATNTTVARPLLRDKQANETGGLSGEPLMAPATHILEAMHQLLADKIPLIGVGGVMSSDNAMAKMAAGAKLVQIYTGLIFQGPQLVREILQTLSST